MDYVQSSQFSLAVSELNDEAIHRLQKEEPLRHTLAESLALLQTRIDRQVLVLNSAAAETSGLNAALWHHLILHDNRVFVAP